MKKILIKYDLPDIIQLLENPPKKENWKTLVYMHVYRYWQDEIINISNYYRFLTFLNPDIYTPGKIHPYYKYKYLQLEKRTELPLNLRS
jgi:hypothetical protein